MPPRVLARHEACEVPVAGRVAGGVGAPVAGFGVGPSSPAAGVLADGVGFRVFSWLGFWLRGF